MRKQHPSPNKRWSRRSIALGVAALVGTLVVSFAAALLIEAWVPMGKLASGTRLLRMEQSPHFSDGQFVDVMPRNEPDMWEILPKWLQARQPNRRPRDPLPIFTGVRGYRQRPAPAGLRITWLGHSTLLISIGGKTVLVDPVWGDYVAPLEIESMRRFVPPALPFDELPHIDLVLISHDHYDHLDYSTIVRLSESEVPFFVPLGVGAHLEYWGISPERIVEHDWWDQSTFDDDLTIVCTPARHFSGRFLLDQDKTLWSGWALLSKDHRVYYSGDTAMFPGFSEIGERFGPFDATMIETGAYNQMWADVHLGPEQAVLAHQMVRGGLLIPVHWGMFDLGLHGWTEPIERTLIAAREVGVQIATPRLGGSIDVDPQNPPPLDRWWPELPFQSAEEHPIVSSGL